MNKWVICPQCWDACTGDVGRLCSECGVPMVETPLFGSTKFDWLIRRKGTEMKCPKCKTTLSTKHYDAEYELYECPKCEGAFTPDEIEEATSGTSPAKRSRAAGKSNKPVAKAKEHKSEIAEDDEAIAKFEAETLKPRESSGPKITKHRDEVETKAVKEIIADEVQEIGYEFGVEIDRLNAVEWYAHNLWLSLHAMNGISARDKKVPMVKCGEHA